MGTAIMEIELAQELASVHQYPLLLVFLDIKNPYDNLYCEQILKTLARYGSGPKLWGLLAECWAHQEVVTGQNVFCGPKFRSIIGTTQGEGGEGWPLLSYSLCQCTVCLDTVSHIKWRTHP